MNMINSTINMAATRQHPNKWSFKNAFNNNKSADDIFSRYSDKSLMNRLNQYIPIYKLLAAADVIWTVALVL